MGRFKDSLNEEKFNSGDKLKLKEPDYKELKKVKSELRAGWKIGLNPKLTLNTIYTFIRYDGSNAMVSYDKKYALNDFDNLKISLNADRFIKV